MQTSGSVSVQPDWPKANLVSVDEGQNHACDYSARSSIWKLRALASRKRHARFAAILVSSPANSGHSALSMFSGIWLRSVSKSRHAILTVFVNVAACQKHGTIEKYIRVSEGTLIP